MRVRNRRKLRILFRAWFESFLTFELVLHFKDLIKKDVLVQAGLAALFPILYRWVNPKDKFPDGD